MTAFSGSLKRNYTIFRLPETLIMRKMKFFSLLEMGKKDVSC